MKSSFFEWIVLCACVLRMCGGSYQQEERTDNFPANAPVETRSKAKHLVNVLAELVQTCIAFNSHRNRQQMLLRRLVALL